MVRTEKSKASGSETRQRTRVVQVRLSEAEYAEITSRADAALLTPASYVRDAVLDAPAPRARRRPAVEAVQVARVLAQLGKIGSNLNQLARQANAGLPVPRDALARALADVSAMRDATMACLGRAK
jgi:predicted kinase